MNAGAIAAVAVIVLAGFGVRWLVTRRGGRMSGLTQGALTVTGIVAWSIVAANYPIPRDPQWPAYFVGVVGPLALMSWFFWAQD